MRWARPKNVAGHKTIPLPVVVVMEGFFLPKTLELISETRRVAANFLSVFGEKNPPSALAYELVG